MGKFRLGSYPKIERKKKMFMNERPIGFKQGPDPSKNQMFVGKNCQRTASSLEGSSGFENHQCRVHIPDRYPEVLSLEKRGLAQHWCFSGKCQMGLHNQGFCQTGFTNILPEGLRVSLKVDYTTKLKQEKRSNSVYSPTINWEQTK